MNLQRNTKYKDYTGIVRLLFNLLTSMLFLTFEKPASLKSMNQEKKLWCKSLHNLKD